jgi:transglutaminase-like putative cysteine protease
MYSFYFYFVRYDVDGYFGRTSRAASDANSVMRGGSSVCEGYANVMEALCKYVVYVSI